MAAVKRSNRVEKLFDSTFSEFAKTGNKRGACGECKNKDGAAGRTISRVALQDDDARSLMTSQTQYDPRKTINALAPFVREVSNSFQRDILEVRQIG